MTLAHYNLENGRRWRFGPDWPGQRCGAKTRKGTECQKAALRGKTQCQFHGGKSTGPRTKEGLQRLTASKTKHGKLTKEKRAEARRKAEESRRIWGRIKMMELRLKYAGLLK